MLFSLSVPVLFVVVLAFGIIIYMSLSVRAMRPAQQCNNKLHSYTGTVAIARAQERERETARSYCIVACEFINMNLMIAFVRLQLLIIIVVVWCSRAKRAICKMPQLYSATPGSWETKFRILTSVGLHLDTLFKCKCFKMPENIFCSQQIFSNSDIAKQFAIGHAFAFIPIPIRVTRVHEEHIV